MMNHVMQTLALMEMSITCALVFIYLLEAFSRQSFSLVLKIFLLLLLGNLFFWPLGKSLELPLAAYVRGVMGDLSIVTTLLIWATLLPKNSSTPVAFKFGLVLIGFGFYPFALGLGMIDPYAWGYGSITFFITVLLFASICGLANWSKGVLIIGFAIIAWSFHWHESSNLWDYLLDPLLVLWAMTSLLGSVLQKRRVKARSSYLFRAG